MSTKISLVREVILSEKKTTYYLLFIQDDIVIDKANCPNLLSANIGYDRWVKFAKKNNSNDFINNLEVTTLKSEIIE